MSRQKVDNDMITGLTSSKLTGAMPAISASALTGIGDGITKSASDPAIDTNPSGGVGTLWLNTTDSNLFACTDATTDSNVWYNVGGGTGDVRLSNLGNRGMWAGGVSSYTDQINYISIPTAGNATDFGNLLTVNGQAASASNVSRMMIIGGSIASGVANRSDTIQYVTFSTPGNATDFGDLLTPTDYITGGSNGSRAVVGSGNKSVSGSTVPRINDISYITLATPGNAVDFGDLTLGRNAAAHASLERALWAGGHTGSVYTNTIDYVTISTTGNAQDFGDHTANQDGGGSMGNTIRAMWVGGVIGAGSVINTVAYSTMATLGNATDFGDCSNTSYDGDGTGNDTRAVYGLGLRWSGGVARVNTLEYFTILTPGNATDFGDLEYASDGWTASSGD